MSEIAYKISPFFPICTYKREKKNIIYVQNVWSIENVELPLHREILSKRRIMDMTELIEKVNTVLAEEFEVEVEEISAEKSIKETLDLDSLSLVDLVALIEEEFSVKIAGDRMKEIQTFGDLYNFLSENA